MRINFLELIAFGPFTDQTIALEEGKQGLHLIHGPNEAGKSSALRAIDQLLYGIPPRSADDFIHAYQNLRIGGTLVNDAGKELNIVRRKGKTNTLYEDDEETLVPDSKLLRFLGGLDRTLFRTLFGIGHQELVQGGRAISQGQGEVGELLFAAGAGVTDLRTLQAELESEMKELFGEKGAKYPAINAAALKMSEIRKTMREATLTAREWNQNKTLFEQTLEQREAIQGELNLARKEKNRLERILAALPHISRLAQIEAELAQCADAPILPEDFGARRREAMATLAMAEQNLAKAREVHAEIFAQHLAVDVPRDLIEHAERITALSLDLGSHIKAGKDSLRLATEIRTLEKEAKDILAQLPGSPSLERIAGNRLDKTKQTAIETLAREYERFAAAYDSARQDIARLEPLIEYLAKERDNAGDPPEPGPLRRAMERCQALGPLEESRDAELAEADALDTAVRLGLERQTLWSGTPRELESLPLPGQETLDAFSEDFSQARSAVESLAREKDSKEQNVAKLKADLQRLRLETDPPSQEDLDAARELRGQGWRLVREAWVSGVPPHEHGREYVESMGNARDLAEAFEAAQKSADAVSDRLRREAGEVARQARLQADIQAGQQEAARLDQQLTNAAARLEDVQARWLELWSGLSIQPLSPREMNAWSRDLRSLIQQATLAREKRTRAEKLRTRIETQRLELLDCLRGQETATASDTATLARCLAWAKEHLGCWEAELEQRETLARELKEKKQQLVEARARLDKAQADISAWRGRWATAIAPLDLAPDAEPPQATAVLQERRDIHAKLKDVEERRQRIQGIERDANEFREKLGRLLAPLAPDLLDASLEEAAPELMDRLNRAKELEARKKELGERLTREEQRIKDQEERIAETRALLETMRLEAQCETIGDLQAAEERSRTRIRLEAERAQAEERVIEQALGASLEEFIQESRAVDPEEALPEIERLDGHIHSLEAERSDLDQKVGSTRRILEEMEERSRVGQASNLSAQAQSVLAKMENDLEQYARLRLASSMLKRAMASYREKNQGPILARAGEYFRRMTRDSFTGLRLDMTDSGDMIVGVRPDGKSVPVDPGMSEGTADQLFLSFRLASVLAYLEGHESIPFIVDDILVNCDDERAAATLDVLADLSRKTQVIFFTHHSHLVELAKQRLPQDVLFTHSLER